MQGQKDALSSWCPQKSAFKAEKREMCPFFHFSSYMQQHNKMSKRRQVPFKPVPTLGASWQQEIIIITPLTAFICDYNVDDDDFNSGFLPSIEINRRRRWAMQKMDSFTFNVGGRKSIKRWLDSNSTQEINEHRLDCLLFIQEEILIWTKSGYFWMEKRSRDCLIISRLDLFRASERTDFLMTLLKA